MTVLDRRQFFTVAAGSMAVVAGASACAGSAVQGDDGSGGDQSGPIRLGLTTALTGAYSEFGVPMKNSVDIGLKEFNDKGGVLGRQVELVSYDDQLVAEVAQTNMRRLLDEDRVDFVVAPAGSGPTLAVLPLVNAQKKIMVNTIAQTSTIVYPDGPQAPPNDNIFSFSLGNLVETAFMGGMLAQRFRRIGLIAESTPYGTTGLDELERVIREGGASVVARENYDQQATDVTAQLARLRAAGSEVIAMIGLGNDTATLRETMARLGMLNIPFVISNGGGTIPYEERAGRLVDGTIVVHYKAFGGGEPTTESARTFSSAYRAAYGNDRYYGPGEWPIPSFGGTPASSYDAVKVLLDGIVRAGSTENARVIAALESGQPLTGARGDYQFSNQKHDAVTTDLLTFNVYRAAPDGTISYEPFGA